MCRTQVSSCLCTPVLLAFIQRTDRHGPLVRVDELFGSRHHVFLLWPDTNRSAREKIRQKVRHAHYHTATYSGEYCRLVATPWRPHHFVIRLAPEPVLTLADGLWHRRHGIFCYIHLTWSHVLCFSCEFFPGTWYVHLIFHSISATLPEQLRVGSVVE